VRDINVGLGPHSARGVVEEAYKVFTTLSGVLGLLQKKTGDLDSEIEALIEKRQQARREKNWAVADRIRDELKARGIILEDTPQGVRWKRV